MRTWLVLDCHYLCHRAFHTSRDLSWKGKPSGVIFGFLKTISALKDRFQTDHVAFCFEHRHIFRRNIYPAYKAHRRTKERTGEERRLYESLCIQISELKERYLPKIGFRNIFCFRGMESDDIMAAIAGGMLENEEVVLVTSDSDLYQCLRSNVSIWSPQKRRLLTERWFQRQYGIQPRTWSVVKAIAGCPSDGVKGIEGVGEITALKFIRGELDTGSKAFQSISSEKGREIVRRNKSLVKLPFEGCPTPVLRREDNVTEESWISVCGMLGMRSIANHPPIATRKLK